MSRNDHAAAAIAEWAQTLVDASVGLDVGRIAEVSTCPEAHRQETSPANASGTRPCPFHTRSAPFWWRLRGCGGGGGAFSHPRRPILVAAAWCAGFTFAP